MTRRPDIFEKPGPDAPAPDDAEIQRERRRRLALAEIISAHTEQIVEECLQFRLVDMPFKDPAPEAVSREILSRVLLELITLMVDVLSAPSEETARQAQEAFRAVYSRRGWLAALRGDPPEFHQMKALNFANVIWRVTAPEIVARFDRVSEAVAACSELYEHLINVYATSALGYTRYELQALRERETAVSRLMEDLRQAEERERARIASGLHDGPAQLLVDLMHGLEVCLRLLPEDPENCAEELRELYDLTQGGVREIRNLIYMMRPVRVEEGCLGPTLQEYARAFHRTTGIAAYVRVVGDPETLPPGAASLLMLVAREALANVGKHAEARSVQVRLVEETDHVRLRVADNGRGFDVAAAMRRADAGRTFGLALMSQRAQLLGGRLQISSRPGRGTVVTLTVPKERTAE